MALSAEPRVEWAAPGSPGKGDRGMAPNEPSASARLARRPRCLPLGGSWS